LMGSKHDKSFHLEIVFEILIVYANYFFRKFTVGETPTAVIYCLC
jgi:hypothetical protein